MMRAFRRTFSFSDAVFAKLCGLFADDAAEEVRLVEAAVDARIAKRLAPRAFGAPSQGLLVDRRFAALVNEALKDLPILALGGCVHAVSEDGPCGAILGAFPSPPESAPEGLLRFPLGQREACCLLKPGVGGGLCFPRTPDLSPAFWEALDHFEKKERWPALAEDTDGCILVLDYDPSAPSRECCYVWECPPRT